MSDKQTETRPSVRKGIKIYIDYFENEFEDLTAEEIGMLIVSLYEYDKFDECSTYKEKIQADKTLRMIYKRLCTNNDRAVAEWERKKKAREEARARAKEKAEQESTQTTTETTVSETQKNTIEYELNNVFFSFDINTNKLVNIPAANEMRNYINKLKESYKQEEKIEAILQEAYKLALKDKCGFKFEQYIHIAEQKIWEREDKE